MFILLAALVLVMVLGVVAARFLNGSEKAETVDVAEAEIRTVTQVVTASGRAQPEVEIVISPDVSGEIIELAVIEGQQVRQGELLVRIKPDFYRAQVEQADANVSQNQAFMAQRKADLLNAEQDLARQRRLFENEVIAEDVFQQSQTQFDIAKAALEAARFSVESSEARLRESREQLSKTVLYSPMAGTVSKLNVELGERVVGTTQMAGTEMMTIARLEQMELEVEVNENDVVNVALGDSSAIEIDAYPDRIFRGVVTEIANSARLLGAGSQEQVTNFPVKIRIVDAHNAEARLAAGKLGGLAEESPVARDYPSFRPGMSGTVDIFTETVVDVVAVPIQAITVRDFNEVRRIERRHQATDGESGSGDEDGSEARPGGMQDEDLRKAVFVMEEDGKARVIGVETGIADDRYIVVTEGLEGGEKVVTGPYSAVSRTLRPGTALKVRGGGAQARMASSESR